MHTCTRVSGQNEGERTAIDTAVGRRNMRTCTRASDRNEGERTAIDTAVG